MWAIVGRVAQAERLTPTLTLPRSPLRETRTGEGTRYSLPPLGNYPTGEGLGMGAGWVYPFNTSRIFSSTASI